MTAPPRSSPDTPEERLLRRTRWHLAAVTMALVAVLLVTVGVVTRLAATRLMDENVARAMDAALQVALHESDDLDDDPPRTPAGSDTFALFMDATGRVVGNPSGIALAGLPDPAAIAESASGATDRRDGTYGGVPVRLLTRQVAGGDAATDGHDESHDDGSSVAFVQVGFVLSLYQEQQRELVLAIASAVLLGILGAVVVTLIVTNRALSPIRRAFAAERRFVAAASHELRTPVAIIRASAEVMQREGHATPDGQPLLADIVAETDRLGRLVGDLLALASAEAGAVAIHARSTPLGPWIDETARRIDPMIAAAGLTLSTETEALAEAVALVDPDRLTQLLLVLVDNAVAHSPAGGRIHLAATREGARTVAITVTDQGPGVPDELRERIFEPFARTPGARRVQGSGLGLAIARQLAMRQGATLAVADAAHRPQGWGTGACFVLRLPLTPSDAIVTGRPVPGPSSPS